MLPLQSVEILKKLDKKELKRFGDFLSSPYFNNSVLILKIFDAVKKEYPNFTGKLLQSEVMFKKLYPSEEFKETRIQNLYSEFGRLLREFVGYEIISSKPYEIDLNTVEYLTKKSLYDISNKLILKSLSENNDGLLSDANMFNYFFKIKSHYYHDLASLKPEQIESYKEFLKSESETLIFFFLREISNFRNSIKEARILLPDNPDGSLLIDEFANSFDIGKILKYLDNEKPEYASYMKTVYYLFYYTDESLSEEQFSELREGLKKIIFRVTDMEKNILLEQLIDYKFPKLIAQDKKYLHDAFEFCELFYSLKIYPNKSLYGLRINTFRNIFTTSVMLKKYDWAEKFIDEYAYYLPEDIIQKELNYAKGVLYSKKGMHKESLDYFNKMELKDIIEKVNVRFHYLLNFIELKAYESALSSLHTIRQFSYDRKEIPEQFLILIQNSIKFLTEIIRCEIDNTKPDVLIYKEAIGPARCFLKSYIIEKMVNLENKTA